MFQERQTILTIGAPDTSRPGKRFINILILEGLKIHENKPTMFLKFSDLDFAERLLVHRVIEKQDLKALHESNSEWLEMDPSISQHLSQVQTCLIVNQKESACNSAESFK